MKRALLFRACAFYLGLVIVPNLAMASGGIKQSVWVFGDNSPPQEIYSTKDFVSWTDQAPVQPGMGWTGVIATWFGNQFVMAGGFSGASIMTSPDGINWTSSPAPAWYPRYSNSAAQLNGSLFVMGGWDSDASAYKNDTWSSTDGVNWTQTTPSASWSARGGQASVSYQGKLWVFGGQLSGSQLANDIYSSTDGQTWTQVLASAPWAPRDNHQTLVFKNKVYILGGHTGNCDDCSAYDASDVWVAKNGLTKWTKLLDNAPWGVSNGEQVGRAAACAFVYKGKMWVIGGTGFSGNGELSDYGGDIWNSADGITWVHQPNAAWANESGLFEHECVVAPL